MNFLIANIGGSKAYKNVLDFLKQTKFASDLPDIAVIQEPGDNFRGLQPFFHSHNTIDKIRIHQSKSPLDIEVTLDNVFDIITIKLSSIPNSPTFKHIYGLVFTYRQHSYKEHIYYNRLNQIMKDLKKSTVHQLIAGDLNATTKNKHIAQLTTTYQLSDLTTSTQSQYKSP